MEPTKNLTTPANIAECRDMTPAAGNQHPTPLKELVLWLPINNAPFAYSATEHCCALPVTSGMIVCRQCLVQSQLGACAQQRNCSNDALLLQGRDGANEPAGRSSYCVVAATPARCWYCLGLKLFSFSLNSSSIASSIMLSS